MIGRLSGQIGYRGPDHVLIDVGGVGYVVHVSERTLSALPGVGASTALYTDLLVREDLLQLVGFPTLQEKEWHRLLTGVQGIGARAAMAILGALGADGLARAIALGDWAAVKSAPGVGPKIAQRVVNELKDKAPALMATDAGRAAAPGVASASAFASATTGTAAGPPATQAEAMSALANLGYAPTEAARAVAEAADDATEADTATLIRAALKRLAPKDGR